MKKYLFIILFAVGGLVSALADDNVEQMASTLGDGESPTVGTNLLLNIKPRKVSKTAALPTDDLSGDAGGSISIINGTVQKKGATFSGSAVAGAGISNFNSGRRSSSGTGGSSAGSGSVGGPRKALGGGGSDEPEPGDRPDPYKDPIGAIPFALMLMLAVGYGLYKKLIFNS